jgi:hypothetical protein
MTPKMPRFWPEMKERHNARLFSRCVLQRGSRSKKSISAHQNLDQTKLADEAVVRGRTG